MRIVFCENHFTNWLSVRASEVDNRLLIVALLPIIVVAYSSAIACLQSYSQFSRDHSSDLRNRRNRFKERNEDKFKISLTSLIKPK